MNRLESQQMLDLQLYVCFQRHVHQKRQIQGLDKHS